MRLTFPRLGDAHLLAKPFFQELGIELVVPQANTQESLARGAAISPEEMCLPFKLMMGNLLDAGALGADTVLMPATMGPCRLGEYAELLKTLLDAQGLTFDWILLDSPQAVGFPEVLKRFAKMVGAGGKPFPFILRRGITLYGLNHRLESFLKRARALSGTERDDHKGRIKQLVSACRGSLESAESLSELDLVLRSFEHQLDVVSSDPAKRPLRILVTGEIFSNIEPFANHHLEELLMDLEVSFEMPVTIGWWLDRTIVNPLRLFTEERKENPYMPYEIGGYARDTVGAGWRSRGRGFDGVIQLLPAGCMPEIVAKSVFSRMSRDEDLKVLSVIFDEMGGEAGYITRVEAFVDLLERSRTAAAGFAG